MVPRNQIPLHHDDASSQLTSTSPGSSAGICLIKVVPGIKMNRALSPVLRPHDEKKQREANCCAVCGKLINTHTLVCDFGFTSNAISFVRYFRRQSPAIYGVRATAPVLNLIRCNGEH
jgi:hypothetical protein